MSDARLPAQATGQPPVARVLPPIPVKAPALYTLGGSGITAAVSPGPLEIQIQEDVYGLAIAPDSEADMVMVFANNYPEGVLLSGYTTMGKVPPFFLSAAASGKRVCFPVSIERPIVGYLQHPIIVVATRFTAVAGIAWRHSLLAYREPVFGLIPQARTPLVIRQHVLVSTGSVLECPVFGRNRVFAGIRNNSASALNYVLQYNMYDRDGQLWQFATGSNILNATSSIVIDMDNANPSGNSLSPKRCHTWALSFSGASADYDTEIEARDF